jgi:hypothetical protein
MKKFKQRSFVAMQYVTFVMMIFAITTVAYSFGERSKMIDGVESPR